MDRTSLIVLLFFFSIRTLKATNYYVSNRGNDRNNGKSPRRAWNSLIPLQKIKLYSGDSILLERGSTIVGSLEIKYSGDANKPIVIASYGTGEAPILSGANFITKWAKIDENIFESNVPTPIYDLYWKTQRLTPARFPNRGYLQIEKGIGKDSIFCKALNQENNFWEGATLRIRTIDWVYETRTIKSSKTGLIVQGPQSRYPTEKSFISRTENGEKPIYDFKKGYGFYLEGLPSLVDSTWEWSWKQGKLRVFLPQNFNTDDITLLASSREYGIFIKPHIKNIVIKGIQFRYFEKAGVGLGFKTSQISIIENNFSLIHGTAIDLDSASHKTLIQKNQIRNILGRGIAALEPEYLTIEDNIVSNIGLSRGHGWSGVNGATGILIYNTERKASPDTTYSHNNIVRLNRVDSCGYNGIRVDGHHNLVEYNLIEHCSLTLNDGANLYCFAREPQVTHHSIFRKNIIRYSIGDSEMTPQNPNLAFGIYIDNNSHDILVEDNTVIQTNAAGLVNNDASFRNTFRRNTVFDCKNGIEFAEWANHDRVFDCVVEGNVIVSLYANQRGPKLSNFIGDKFKVGRFDYNTYINTKSTQFFFFETKQVPEHSKLNLAFWQWKKIIDGDENSTVISASTDWSKVLDPIIFVNESKETRKFQINETLYDIKGVVLKDSFSLPAFSSIIMFKKRK